MRTGASAAPHPPQPRPDPPPELFGHTSLPAFRPPPILATPSARRHGLLPLPAEDNDGGGSAGGGGWSHAHNPSPPALLLPVARPSCDMVLPGCEAELLRFENDYVKFRCLPQSASDYLVDLAKDTLEVFKDVEKQSCCVTTAENATLYANIGTLMNAAAISGSCGFPYTSLPDYSADAYKCHGMSECDDVLEDFEDDYVKHGCMPKGNSVHDEFAISLLECVRPPPTAPRSRGRGERGRVTGSTTINNVSGSLCYQRAPHLSTGDDFL